MIGTDDMKARIDEAAKGLMSDAEMIADAEANNEDGYVVLWPSPERRVCHAVPLHDIRPHLTDRECWCNPSITEEGDIMHHRSESRR